MGLEIVSKVIIRLLACSRLCNKTPKSKASTLIYARKLLNITMMVIFVTFQSEQCKAPTQRKVPHSVQQGKAQ